MKPRTARCECTNDYHRGKPCPNDVVSKLGVMPEQMLCHPCLTGRYCK